MVVCEIFLSYHYLALCVHLCQLVDGDCRGGSVTVCVVYVTVKISSCAQNKQIPGELIFSTPRSGKCKDDLSSIHLRFSMVQSSNPILCSVLLVNLTNHVAFLKCYG